MYGIRFYLEYQTKQDKRNGTVKNPGKHTGNIIAIDVDSFHVQSGQILCEGLSAVFFEANSPVAFGGISLDYLQAHGKRVPEKLARKIHPRLFERLDL